MKCLVEVDDDKGENKFRRQGQWSDATLVRLVMVLCGYRSLHDELARPLSNLLRILEAELSCLLDQVNLWPLKGRSSRGDDEKKEKNCLDLSEERVGMPPFLSVWKRDALKSPIIRLGNPKFATAVSSYQRSN